MDIVRKKPKKIRKSPTTPSEKERYLEFEKSFEIRQHKRLPKRYENNNKKKRTLGRKIFSVFLKLLLIIFIAAFILGIYFGWKFYSVSKNMNLENNSKKTILNELHSVVAPISSTLTKKHIPLKGEDKGRINILLLGIAGENKPGKNLTDTIMIMSIDTETNKVGLLSLPRDLYVEIPKVNYSTKINSVYQYGLNNDQGIDPLKEVITEVTGLPMHYYLVMDFEGFEKAIDAVGGINVYVERDIYDNRYPGPNYSYETFEIKKGLHLLDGKTALKYARERHSDPDGDFGRAKRQQKVIQATKNKVFSLKTVLNVFALDKLLNTLESNIKTNVELDEIESFIQLSKKVDSQNISNAVVDAWKKDSLLRVSHVYYGDIRAFTLVPRIGNYSEIHDLSENLFDLDALHRRKIEIENENSSLALINTSGNNQLTYKVLRFIQEDLGFKKVTILRSEKDNQQQTLVFDLSNKNKPFSLDEIIKRVPSSLSKTEIESFLPDIQLDDYDFILTLGKDIEKIYTYEEITKEEFDKNSEFNLN